MHRPTDTTSPPPPQILSFISPKPHSLCKVHKSLTKHKTFNVQGSKHLETVSNIYQDTAASKHLLLTQTNLTWLQLVPSSIAHLVPSYACHCIENVAHLDLDVLVLKDLLKVGTNSRSQVNEPERYPIQKVRKKRAKCNVYLQLYLAFLSYCTWKEG
jgi:hypothetical protein